jgi:hypothetical protein
MLFFSVLHTYHQEKVLNLAQGQKAPQYDVVITIMVAIIIIIIQRMLNIKLSVIPVVIGAI